MLTEIRDWTMWLAEWGILIYVGLEYHYDKAKDLAKAQKKTRTTKRTTQNKDGGTTVEESTETTEPLTSVCKHLNTWFDRTLDENGEMHTRCSDCGIAL